MSDVRYIRHGHGVNRCCRRGFRGRWSKSYGRRAAAQDAGSARGATAVPL